jgi:UTP--glucose-1-phosphate uridylyltransferase
MNKRPTKAIIMVAGFGSRMLPVTKAVEKCMLPVANRPVIDYVVQDCIKAGVNHIIFIVSEENAQIRKYYSEDEKLEKYLREQGKEDMLDLVKVPQGVEFSYIVQNTSDKYGSAVPVALAQPLIKDDEQVLVLGGDDFVWNSDDSSEFRGLLDIVESGEEAALVGVPVTNEDISRYGVIKMVDGTNNYEKIVEKPLPEEAPSNLINISKYLFPRSLIETIVEYVNKPKEGKEYMITDPINTWVKEGGVLRVKEAQGKFLDGGNLAGWLEANNYLAEHKSV